MELFKPSRFNADKCITVLMGTRNAATLRAVFCGIILCPKLKFPKFCRGRLGSSDKGTGAQQYVPLCKQVLTPTQNTSCSSEVHCFKSLN